MGEKLSRIADHTFIILTVVCTVYSQLIMRWQVSAAGQLPIEMSSKISFIVNLLINPWVLSGILATFLAGVSWMLAMTKFDLSYAYPFVSLNYVFIMAAGFFLFNESMSPAKIAGSALVVIGILVMAKG